MQAYPVAARDGAFDRDLGFGGVDRGPGGRPPGLLGGRGGGGGGVAPRRNAVLAGAAAGAFVGDELAVIEDLAAPHTGGLPTFERAGQAG